ncbi:MAG: hypothetical protein F4060_07100 [Holophagales bacterium]|nr:hypothetical protein [Holophagales bacterium]MYG31849.1 hypothetical protein [Holophagales bacterium]MYI79691.1 hypothetical protein [Holophagales bacterium]
MVRRGIDAWALGAAVVLGAITLASPLVGVAAWQPAAMAGAVAAGLLYVTCRVLALEPLLERAAGAGRPPLVFLLLPFGLYLALIPWSIHERAPDGDEPWFLLTTHSIAYDFDVDVANNYRNQDSLAFMPRAIEPQPGDPETDDGTIRSRHGAVLQAVMAPAYRLGGRAGAMVVIAALAALGAWLLLDLTAFSQDARARLAAYAIFSFSAPFLIYSQQIWAEVAAVVLAVAAFRWIDRLTGGKESPTTETEGAEWTMWALLALSLALLPAIKLRLALISVALALILVLRLAPARRRRGLLVLAAVGVPSALLVLWSNRAVFGTVLGMHSWGELEVYRQPASKLALGLNGLFFDLAYGLVACAPIWLLLFPGAVASFRRNRRLLFEVALIAVPTLLLVASRREWYGGWSPPFRYGLVVLPFLALLLVPLFERRPDLGRQGGEGSVVRSPAAGIVALALVLALLSGALTVLFVVEPGWTYNLADGRHHFLHHLEARTGLDLARLLPSATRARTATWLLPVLAVAVAILAPRVRRRSVAAACAGLPLLFLAALPVLADSLPTRRLEIESAAVHRTGGNQEPERWTLDRTRYPEAWVLPEGSRAEAAVIPGGDRVEIAVVLRVIRNRAAPVTLVARAGGQELGRLTFAAGSDDDWQTRAVAPAPWPAGAQLVLEVPRGNAMPANGLAIDRVDLRWR